MYIYFIHEHVAASTRTQDQEKVKLKIFCRQQLKLNIQYRMCFMYLSILNSQTANSKQMNSQQTTNSCMYVHIVTVLSSIFLFKRFYVLPVPKNHPTQCKKSSFMNDEMNVVECKLPKQYIPTNNVSWNDASLDSTFRQTLFHIVPRCTNALHIRRVHWLPQDASTVARGGRDQYV